MTPLPGFARLTGPLLRSPDDGADTIVWLLARPEDGLGPACGTTVVSVRRRASRSVPRRPSNALSCSPGSRALWAGERVGTGPGAPRRTDALKRQTRARRSSAKPGQCRDDGRERPQERDVHRLPAHDRPPPGSAAAPSAGHHRGRTPPRPRPSRAACGRSRPSRCRRPGSPRRPTTRRAGRLPVAAAQATGGSPQADRRSLPGQSESRGQRRVARACWPPRRHWSTTWPGSSAPTPRDRADPAGHLAHLRVHVPGNHLRAVLGDDPAHAHIEHRGPGATMSGVTVRHAGGGHDDVGSA